MPGCSIVRCGSPARSGKPDAVRAPPATQALLPATWMPSCASSRASSPRTSRAWRSHSCSPMLPKRTCCARWVASGVHGSHSPGTWPRWASSGTAPRIGTREPGVHAGGVRRHERLGLGAARGQGLSRRRLDLQAPRERVPRLGELALDDGRGRAGRPEPEPLELPGPVAGGDPALAVRQVGHRLRAQVRDAVRVAEQAGHGPTLRARRPGRSLSRRSAARTCPSGSPRRPPSPQPWCS